MMKGYSPIVTAGLIGYIGWESKFDPTIEEIGNRIGYGLCQWSFSRRNDLINWCNSHGYDYTTVQGQLEYMYYEIEVKDTLFHDYCTYGCYDAVCGGYHEGIGGLTGFKNLKDIYEVVWCFTWWWGRPNAAYHHIDDRYEIAQIYYTQFYVNNSGSGGGSATGTLGWPYAGGINCSRVSQKLGPYYGGTSGFDYDHRGWDIAYGYGTNIIAADGGTVIHAGWGEDVTYGISVTIDHGNGLFTRYAHMSNYAVSAGQTVSKGQIIGNEGTTGNVDGSHVHFEILQGNQWGTILNPYNYYPQCGN